MLKEKISVFIDKIKAIEGVSACALVSRDGIIAGKFFDQDMNEPWFGALSATILASAESVGSLIKLKTMESVTIRAQDTSIVVMGQPELKAVLAREELRQLRQRILINYELNPLNLTDVAHYIQHRLTLAGGLGRPAFSRWAMRAIHRYSEGIPRIINNLCDKSLLSAYIRDSDEVTFWDVRRAHKDMRHLTD